MPGKGGRATGRLRICVGSAKRVVLSGVIADDTDLARLAMASPRLTQG